MKKIKVYSEPAIEIQILKEKIKSEFKINENLDFTSDSLLFTNFNEIKNSPFDYLELSSDLSHSLLEKEHSLDWEFDILRAADGFIKLESIIKPTLTKGLAFKKLIELKKLRIDTSKAAVLVGEYCFISSFCKVLSQVGFKKIYIVNSSLLSVVDKLDKLSRILFDVQIIESSIEEISDNAQICSLLLTEFEVSHHPDLSEAITYFNFLSENALFLDLLSYKNSHLTEEAEKASLQILNSVEFHSVKYQIIENLFAPI